MCQRRSDLIRHGRQFELPQPTASCL